MYAITLARIGYHLVDRAVAREFEVTRNSQSSMTNPYIK